MFAQPSYNFTFPCVYVGISWSVFRFSRTLYRVHLLFLILLIIIFHWDVKNYLHLFYWPVISQYVWIPCSLNWYPLSTYLYSVTQPFFFSPLIQDYFSLCSQCNMANDTSLSFIYYSIDFLLILKKIFIGDTRKKSIAVRCVYLMIMSLFWQIS